MWQQLNLLKRCMKSLWHPVAKIWKRFILCDHVLVSLDHSVLWSIVILWLAGKMKRILRSDWLPNFANINLSCRLVISRFIPQEKIFFLRYYKTLLTKLVWQNDWTCSGLLFFSVFVDLYLVPAHQRPSNRKGTMPWSISRPLGVTLSH